MSLKLDSRRGIEARVLSERYGCGFVLFSISHKTSPPLCAKGGLLKVRGSTAHLEASLETRTRIGQAQEHLTGASVLPEPYGSEFVSDSATDQKASPPSGEHREAIPREMDWNDSTRKSAEDSMSLCRNDKRRTEASVPSGRYGCCFVLFSINRKASPLCGMRGELRGATAQSKHL